MDPRGDPQSYRRGDARTSLPIVRGSNLIWSSNHFRRKYQLSHSFLVRNFIAVEGTRSTARSKGTKQIVFRCDFGLGPYTAGRKLHLIIITALRRRQLKFHAFLKPTFLKNKGPVWNVERTWGSIYVPYFHEQRSSAVKFAHRRGFFFLRGVRPVKL